MFAKPSLSRPVHGGVRLFGFVGLLGIALFTLICYWASARSLINVDPVAFSVAAREYWNGKRLYSAVWVDRPFLSILFYLIPYLAAPGLYEGLQLFLGLWVALPALWFYWLARDKAPQAAWVAAAAYLLTPFLSRHFMFASANSVANPFVLALLLTGSRIFQQNDFKWSHCLWVGALCGVLAHTRQNAVLSGLIPVIALMLSRASLERKLRGLMIVTSSAVLTFALILIPVAVTGDLRGYLDLLFALPRRAAQSVPLRKLIGEAAVLIQSVGNSGLAAWVVIFYALASRRVLSTERKRAFAIFLGTSALVAIVICMTPVRWFPHYWSSLLPFATFAIYEGLKGDEGVLGKYGRALSISLLGYLVFNTVLLTADLGFRRDSIRERKSLDEIARALRPFEGREDTIFGMGSWSIYFLYGSSLPISHSYYWDQYFGSFWDGLRPVSGDDLASAFGKSLPTLWLVQDSEVSFTDAQVENAKTKLLKQYFRDDLYATVLKKDGWTLLKRLPVQPREQ